MRSDDLFTLGVSRRRQPRLGSIADWARVEYERQASNLGMPLLPPPVPMMRRNLGAEEIMGQSWKAPPSTRLFHFHISEHAVERFRQRVDEEHRARDNRDLAMLLDERIWVAYQAGQVQTIVDTESPKEMTKLVQIESRSGATQYVLMREARMAQYPKIGTLVPGGPAGAALAAITLLTQEQTTNNFASGKWRAPAHTLNEQVGKARLELVQAPPAEEVREDEPKSRGSTVARVAFVREVLARRPDIRASGKDGMSELVKERFGTGMSVEFFNNVRDQWRAERGDVETHQVTPGVMAPLVTHASAPTPSPVPASAPVPQRLSDAATVVPPWVPPPPAPPAAPTLAERLTAALEFERASRASLAQVQAALAEATATAERATQTVEAVMAEITGARAGTHPPTRP